ncbi:MAG: hypothetical protein ACJATV_000155 [Granulosicoccus sp.]|jgi:hypothetical protein
MTIKHPFYTICLASIAFIGPHSEALFNHSTAAESSHSSYHCQLGYQKKNIAVHYQADDVYHSVCRVSWQSNSEKEIILWDAQRKIITCEGSAAAIALRLEDRGWQCQHSAF